MAELDTLIRVEPTQRRISPEVEEELDEQTLLLNSIVWRVGILLQTGGTAFGWADATIDAEDRTRLAIVAADPNVPFAAYATILRPRDFCADVDAELGESVRAAMVGRTIVLGPLRNDAHALDSDEQFAFGIVQTATFMQERFEANYPFPDTWEVILDRPVPDSTVGNINIVDNPQGRHSGTWGPFDQLRILPTEPNPGAVGVGVERVFFTTWAQLVDQSSFNLGPSVRFGDVNVVDQRIDVRLARAVRPAH